MASNTYGFRTSLSGYNKGDVTAYIEKMESQHRTEILEYEGQLMSLKDEIRSLNQQLNLMMMATPIVPAAPVVPAVPVAAPEVPKEEPAPVAAPAVEDTSAKEEELMLKELRAYRRAEAVERNANQRVKKLYQQMEGLCDSAMDEFHATDAAVKQTIELIMAQAKTLETAYNTLSEALQVSREKLADMNDQLYVDDEE